MNITFHRLEDERFRPDSELYLESLGIIGSVPAAWLILTLVVLLIYLLTRCCDTKNNKVTSLGDTALLSSLEFMCQQIQKLYNIYYLCQ